MAVADCANGYGVSKERVGTYSISKSLEVQFHVPKVACLIACLTLAVHLTLRDFRSARDCIGPAAYCFYGLRLAPLVSERRHSRSDVG